jgi:translation initiation factor 1
MKGPFHKLEALREHLPPGDAPAPPKDKPLFADKVVVRFTRKGHGGKTVTVVTGAQPAARDALCTEMKRALGCGARVDGGDIVLQGDLVDRAIAFLGTKGAKKIVRGT